MKLSDIFKLVFVLGFFCFSTSGLANSISHIDQQWTEVACRYEIKVIPHAKSKASSSNAWFFWRKPDMIQTQDADGDHGEVWERTTNGSILYRKLYHADKTAVEYMPADMPTNNMSFDWLKLSNMLNQQELNALNLVKKTHVFGRSAELRKGKIDNQIIEVLWLTDDNLPAKIIRKDKASRIELRLVEITPLSAASRKPVEVEEIADYRHIDAIDFGDMENDPFVKKVMKTEGQAKHI